VASSQLMLCREITVVCSEIHTKHINTLCGQNVQFVQVKCGGAYNTCANKLVLNMEKQVNEIHNNSSHSKLCIGYKQK
jgi:hypothetical protein